MRIIIVGCGKVGSELAGQLSAAGHDLTLVDLSERRLDELSNTYDLATVKGSGTSYHVLREAGVQDTDLLIAVTAHDEINLLSCLIARKASGCHAIARVRDPEYVSDLGFIRDELGISMVINPELSTARVVSRLIRFPSAIRVSTFARGRIELLDLKIPHESRLDGMAVCEVNPLLRTDVLLCMVRRDGQTYIPKGDFILRENDNITVIIPPHEQSEFFEKVGLPVKRISSAMLVGGGKISYFLAKILLNSGIAVKIIENKLERCEALSEMLPHATIIYGDGTQTRSFCFVDDVVDAMVLMMTSPHEVTGPINIGNPLEVTIGELADKVLAMIGGPSKLVFRPLPEDDPRQRKPDISRARETLGWEPRVGVHDGLQVTIDHFRQQLDH